MEMQQRGKRTKDRLAEALKQRLRVEPIEKVTVVSLTREVGVDRQTFYYHFTDVYAVLDYLCDREFPMLHSERFWGLPLSERVTEILGVLDEKREVALAMWRADGDALLERHVRGALRASMRAEIERAFQQADIPLGLMVAHADAAVDYVSVALCALDLDWVQRGKQRCSVTEMCRRQRALVCDTIRGLLDEAAAAGRKTCPTR